MESRNGSLGFNGLTLIVPSISESYIEIISFYFPTSLRCLKRFYEGLKGTAKKC